MANEDNLKQIQSTEEAREKGRKGGIKSGQSRRKKKLMSQIYADFLAKKFEIKEGDESKKIAGSDMIAMVIKKVLARSDSSSVALMREIREATEGQKHELTGKDGEDLFSAFLKNLNEG